MDFVPSQRLRSRLSPSPSRYGPSHSLPVPVFISVKRRKGIRHYAACSFNGFFEAEAQADRKYLWSQEEATICCQFPEVTTLQYVWVEIASTAPSGSQVKIYCDEHLVSEKKVRGRSTVRGKLPQLQLLNEVKLTIVSSTCVPKSLGLGEDTRELGVAVSGLVFGKRRTKYRNGLAFQRPLRDRFTKWNPLRKSRTAA